MELLSSDARNTTAFAISSGVPNLPSGILLDIIFLRCSPVSVEASSSLSPGVSVEPGLTAFTRMRAQGGIFRSTGIREHDIELALPPLDLPEQAVKIAELRDVSLHAGNIASDFLHRRSQLRLAASGHEDVRAFVHEPFRRRKSDAAVAAVNECNFSFELTHVLLLDPAAKTQMRYLS